MLQKLALMQAEKSLVNKMIGPIDLATGNRDYNNRFIPRNQTSTDPAPTQTPCYLSFRNLSRDSTFRLVEHVQNQSFYDLIEPIFDADTFRLSAVDSDDAVSDERQKLQKFRYEFFSVNSGSSTYKGSGTSLKKTSGTAQRQGTAYKIYACGMMGNVNNPEILIPLETIVVLAH